MSILRRSSRVIITDGLEARVARLEGVVAEMSKRLDSIENWQRVIVGLQITTIVAVIAIMLRLW